MIIIIICISTSVKVLWKALGGWDVLLMTIFAVVFTEKMSICIFYPGSLEIFRGVQKSQWVSLSMRGSSIHPEDHYIHCFGPCSCTPAFNHKIKKILYFLRVSVIVFFKKPHKWTEELGIGQRKGYSMDHCGTGTLQPTSQFKMTD